MTVKNRSLRLLVLVIFFVLFLIVVYAYQTGEIKKESFQEKIHLTFDSVFYSLFPEALDSNVKKNISNFINNNDEAGLIYSLKMAGIQKNLLAFNKELPNKTLPLCHLSAHRLGEITYDIYREQAFTYFSEWCGGGYLHGVMGEYMKQNGFSVTNIKKICDSFKDNIRNGECIHGVGHGIMGYYNYNLPKAISGCKELKVSTLSTSACFDGIFMENIMAALDKGPFSHSTKWISLDPFFPCNTLEGDYYLQRACIISQVNIMFIVKKGQIKEVAKLCDTLNIPIKKACYYGIGNKIPSYLKNVNPNIIFSNCNFSDPTSSNWCYSGSLKYLVKYYGEALRDQPHKLCSLIQEQSSKITCYKNLGIHLNEFLLGDESKIKKVCSLSERGYENYCLERFYKVKT